MLSKYGFEMPSSIVPDDAYRVYFALDKKMEAKDRAILIHEAKS